MTRLNSFYLALIITELNIKSLSVAGTDVPLASEPVLNLGAMFDSQLIMAPHVKSVVKKSSFFT